MNQTRTPALSVALLPIFFLIGLLALNVTFFNDATLDGSNQLALLLAATLAGGIALGYGYLWQDLLEGMITSIQSAMPSMLILLLIGSLAGTWLLSGVVPTMIYYGLQILHPSFFLVAACLISALVALGTGSSWSTIATIGIALLGIGQTLGMDEGWVAGAIISGAYFGDKLSPLSDTTNLAPAMAGTDLFTHIRYMMLTTVPSILIALVIFGIFGFNQSQGMPPTDTSLVLQELERVFFISPVLFLVPLGLIVLIVRGVPALPALLFGTLIGAVFAVVFQPDLVRQVGKTAGYGAAAELYVGVVKSIYGSISVGGADSPIGDLLTARGMSGMLNTIWLILCAMVFGGIMECTGMLRRITQEIIRLIHSTGSLIGSTVFTCLFFNVTASDQYLAIVVPGRMFRDVYRRRGLAPENLSRTLEDSGTVTSVLVPWNTCGATQAGVLGVATIVYAPYCFFNIISPLMSVLYAYLHIKIRRLDPEDMQE
ncbi:MAG: Na+/H+ antiporter NhaC [Bernardetiaceae bacterium]